MIRTHVLYRGLSQSAIVISATELNYPFGFHLCPQFWQTLRGLPEPINPVISENPLLVVAMAVDPHFGQAITFLSLTIAFVICLFYKTVFFETDSVSG